MTKCDSYMVKEIKKMERLARKADDFDRREYESSPEGYADGTIDAIYEIVHEARLEIKRIAEEQKLEKEQEKLEEQQERRKKKCSAKPSKKMESVVINPLSKATPIATRMAALFHRVISMVGGR